MVSAGSEARKLCAGGAGAWFGSLSWRCDGLSEAGVSVAGSVAGC